MRHFHFASIVGRVNSERRDFSHLGAIFTLKNRPFFQRVFHPGKQTVCHIQCSIEKKTE